MASGEAWLRSETGTIYCLGGFAAVPEPYGLL